MSAIDLPIAYNGNRPLTFLWKSKIHLHLAGLDARLLKFIDIPEDIDDCWEWIGRRDKQGYGRVGSSSSLFQEYHTSGAHRITYICLMGPIPEGRHLDHLCDNTSCVNAYHLEPVWDHENTKRQTQKHRRLQGELFPSHTNQRKPFRRQPTWTLPK